MKSIGTTQNHVAKNHGIYNQDKINAEKTKTEKKSAYTTIDDCINSISEKIDSKFFDTRQIKLTIEKEIGVKYRELERIKNDISQNSIRTNAWQAIDIKVMNFGEKLQKIRTSNDLILDNNIDNFSAKTIDISADVMEHVTLSIENNAPLTDIQFEVQELASSHKLQSVEFSSNLAQVVQEKGNHSNDNMFSAGSFKIVVLNNIRVGEGFAGKNSDITDESAPNHFKVGSFSISVNGNSRNIDIKRGETLESLKQKINNSVNGVKADIVKDSGSYKLVIKSRKAGPEHYYTIVDQKNILNNQFLNDDKSGKYRDFATVTISKGYAIKDIAAAINSHSETTRVDATILRVKEQEYRMVLSAEYAGDGNFIEVEDPDLCLNKVFAEQDATVTLPQNSRIVFDGIIIERESNDIKDLYGPESILMHLKKKTDNPLHMSVVPDVKFVANFIKDFVNSYNELLKEIINHKTNENAGDSFEQLKNDFLLRQIFEDIAIPIKNRMQLEKCGIVMFDQEATVDENGETIPEYSDLLSIDESALYTKIYEDLSAVKAAFILLLKSESQNFMLPLDFERKVINFGSQNVNSITFDIDSNRIGLVSTRSKSFQTDMDNIASKAGQVVINGRAISILAGDSLDILAKKINNAFFSKDNTPDMSASVLQDKSGYYIGLHLIPGINLEIADYDNVLEGLFGANVDQFQSVKFESENDIAVNADGESFPNLLNAGSFKINGRNIDIEKGNTWLDIINKIEEIDLQDLDVIIEESSNQRQIIIQLDNLEEQLKIQDFHGVLNNAFTLVPGSGGRKFFDTTNVANAVLHTETGDITRHVSYRAPNTARNIIGQRALLEIFNMQNEEFMNFRLAYYNRELSEIRETSLVKVSQGIADRMGIKMTNLLSPYSSSITKEIIKLKNEMRELDTKKARLGKECDNLCNNAAATIMTQQENSKMGKFFNKVLSGNQKDEF